MELTEPLLGVEGSIMDSSNTCRVSDNFREISDDTVVQSPCVALRS